MPLQPGHKANFETLRRAVFARDAALVDCRLASTDEAVAVVCAANRHGDGSVELVPLAMLFSDNPYEIIQPPEPNDVDHRSARNPTHG